MTTRKLRLGPLPQTTSIKLTFTCPASLKANLDRYAALHAQTYGESVDAVTLIPNMPHRKTRSPRLRVLRSGYREAGQAMIMALARQWPRQSSLPQRDPAFFLDALMWPPAFKTATLHHSLNGR